jgi:D-sedoheptulose 7-phosphate isomerase
LAVCGADIRATYSAIRECYRSGGKLLLCGNGGSASDADHWAGELLKGFKLRRPLSHEQRTGLASDVADKLQGGLPAIPLTAFPALTTAFANDVDGDLCFAQLTHVFGRRGDVWIGLSTSGNARNVCAAASVARARGLAVLGLSGASGGKLAPLCDHCIRVPSSETFRVQEYHLPIYHCLSLMLEEEFYGRHPSARA